jgi:hypothetical protein
MRGAMCASAIANATPFHPTLRTKSYSISRSQTPSWIAVSS